eukprot:6203113-Pleurochrysis_carterae.AAC.2
MRPSRRPQFNPFLLVSGAVPPHSSKVQFRTLLLNVQLDTTPCWAAACSASPFESSRPPHVSASQATHHMWRPASTVGSVHHDLSRLLKTLFVKSRRTLLMSTPLLIARLLSTFTTSESHACLVPSRLWTYVRVFCERIQAHSQSRMNFTGNGPFTLCFALFEHVPAVRRDFM